MTLILMIIMFTLLSSCSTTSDPYGPLGNSNGNISNGGMSVKSSDWIYFMNYGDNNALYRMRTEGPSEEKISDNEVFYLNIMKDWLIYSNSSDNNFLYRTNLDDFTTERLVEDASSNVLVSEDWVYYINRTDAAHFEEYSRIFRIRPDGSGREQVSTDPADYFNISGDEIYFINYEDHSLSRIRTDGTLQSKISDTPMVNMVIYEDTIYYINGENGENNIWKMNLDGTENVRISEDNATTLNLSDGWIYYASTIDDTPELEIRRMNLDGNDRITFNDDNAISINIHEDWLVSLNLDFNTLLFTQTFVKTDGTERKDYTVTGNGRNGEILTYDMNEKVSTDELTVETITAYATNILKSSVSEAESSIFDEVTDGAYIFLHTIITNDTDRAINLYQELGILEDIETEYHAIYWPLFADITDEADKDVTGFFLPRENYSENLVLEPRETRDIQIFIELYEEKLPIYLGLFSNESLYPQSAFVVNPEEENYIVSWSGSLEIMAERFPEAEISQLNGMVYQLPDEKEEHFFYMFEIKEEESLEAAYYFVRRDDGVIYTGEIVEENPDYEAVPVSPYP